MRAELGSIPKASPAAETQGCRTHNTSRISRSSGDGVAVGLHFGLWSDISSRPVLSH